MSYSKKQLPGRRAIKAMKLRDQQLRNRYIVAQALATAIEANDRLPEEFQKKSDRAEMVRLLEDLWGGDYLRDEARNRLALSRPKLKWPAPASQEAAQ
jgi:hypothetical protein